MGPVGTNDGFRAFERFMKRLLAVPKKELDEKLAAFKRRKRKSRSLAR